MLRPTVALTALASLVVAEPQLYSCEVGKNFWETAWTPDWKAWCCLHHPPLGCPSTSTATGTSTTATSSTETETTTSTSTTIPETTRSTTWTWTSTTTESRDWCSQTCDFDGSSASCNDRITWAGQHVSQDEPDPMAAARELVSAQCDFCSACAVEDLMDADELIIRKFEVPSGFLDARRARAVGLGAATSLCASLGVMLTVGLFVVAVQRRLRPTRRGEMEEQLREAEDDPLVCDE